MNTRTAAALIALGLGGAALPASALEIGESDWVYASDLSARGFTAFGASSVNAVYGMQNGSDIYLCFVLDTSAAQAQRQKALLAELDGTATSRTVPNIPVACVLTQ